MIGADRLNVPAIDMFNHQSYVVQFSPCVPFLPGGVGGGGDALGRGTGMCQQGRGCITGASLTSWLAALGLRHTRPCTCLRQQGASVPLLARCPAAGCTWACVRVRRCPLAFWAPLRLPVLLVSAAWPLMDAMHVFVEGGGGGSTVRGRGASWGQQARHFAGGSRLFQAGHPRPNRSTSLHGAISSGRASCDLKRAGSEGRGGSQKGWLVTV